MLTCSYREMKTATRGTKCFDLAGTYGYPIREEEQLSRQGKGSVSPSHMLDRPPSRMAGSFVAIVHRPGTRTKFKNKNMERSRLPDEASRLENIGLLTSLVK